MINSIKKNKLKQCIFFTIIFWLVAHGYRFFNNLYTCDELGSVFQDDIAYQRSIGRFMQPFNMAFRGVIAAPWLMFVISVVLFTLSFFLISEILSIEKPFTLFIMCGVLSCNMTITCSNGMYIPWVDVYGFALLLSTFGVWLIRKDKIWGYILGILSFVISMGFYQAYIDVALGLILIIILLDIQDKKAFKNVFISSIKMLGSLLISGIVYAIVYKLVLKIHHVSEAASYNTLAGVGEYEVNSLGKMLIGSYKTFFYYLTNQGSFVFTYLLNKSVSDLWRGAITIMVIAVLLIIITATFVISKRNRTSSWHIIFQVLILLILPLTLNMVYILSKGMEHELMIYSFNLVYILFIVMQCRLLEAKNIKNFFEYIVWIPIIIIIWNNIVFSNQVYFKIDMEDRAALSISTRMINDIENTEGYEPGVTPVVIVGSLNNSSNFLPVMYLKDVEIYGNYQTPFNYQDSVPIYWQMYLDSNINIVKSKVDLDIVDRMPDYPENGSIQYIGDVLVIKISN